MTGVLAHPPAPEDGADTETWRALQGVTGLLSGWTDWSVPVPLTGVSDDATHAVTIDNRGTGGHLLIPGQVDVTDGGTQITSLVAGTIAVTTLDATTATIATLNVSGVSTLHATSATALTATGNVALGDQNGDVHTVIGVTTFRNAANTATQALIDAGNNRVIVGSGTALTPDTTPCLQVVGRLYVAPDSANDLALEIRRSSAATVGWDVGVTSTNDLVFKDLTGTETFRAGAVASAAQAVVTGLLRVTGAVTLSGQPRARVYNSANISHTSTGNWQTLTFDSERYDVGAFHSGSGSTLTAPSTGSYLIGGCLLFDSNATGFRGIRISVNAATPIVQEFNPAGAAGGNVVNCATAYDLAAGDTVILEGFQSSGGNLNMTVSASLAPEFWIARYA